MIHLIYIYLIINSFLVGSYIMDSFTDKNLRNYLYCIVIFLFGSIILSVYYIWQFLEFLAKEVWFIDRILFYIKLYTGGYKKFYNDKERWGITKGQFKNNPDSPIYKAMLKIEKRYGTRNK